MAPQRQQLRAPRCHRRQSRHDRESVPSCSTPFDASGQDRRLALQPDFKQRIKCYLGNKRTAGGPRKCVNHGARLRRADEIRRGGDRGVSPNAASCQAQGRRAVRARPGVYRLPHETAAARGYPGPCAIRWPTRFTTRPCGDALRRVPRRSDRLDRQDEQVTDAAQGADDQRAACVDLELPTQPQHLDVNASIEYVLPDSRGAQ